MAIELESADKYFSESVLYNDAWTTADIETKNRALNNSAQVLARRYGRRAIPVEAFYEQALWLLKISKARSQSEQGVTSYSIDGISVTLSQIDRSIAPNVIDILGRKVGRTFSGRQGWIHSNDKYINERLGR